jgi:hypothetical protein
LEVRFIGTDDRVGRIVEGFGAGNARANGYLEEGECRRSGSGSSGGGSGSGGATASLKGSQQLTVYNRNQRPSTTHASRDNAGAINAAEGGERIVSLRRQNEGEAESAVYSTEQMFSQAGELISKSATPWLQRERRRFCTSSTGFRCLRLLVMS